MAAQVSKKKTSRKCRQRKNIFFGLTSRLLMIIVAGLMGISYLSFIINPAKFWLISLFGLAFLPLLAVNFSLLVWAAVRKSKAFIIPLLAILPCVFFLGRYIQFSADSESPSDDANLKVLSYNLGRFALSDRKSGVSDRRQCADSAFAYLKRQDVDIMCLQEFYVDNDDFRAFKTYLRRHFPGYHAEYYMFTGRSGAFGNVTLSRVPVSGKGVLKFDESTNLAIYTDHRVGERRFRVYNCHFESYNISYTRLVKALFHADGDAFSDTGLKMRKSISRRPKQVDQVFSNIEDCPYEAFVCGDFNDNPMSYTYYRMTRDRKDAFVSAGSGFGSTYSHLWPLLRIDYVLVPDRFDARDCEVHRVRFSDHYPVVAEVMF